jgi:2-oxoglutarate dehydrogenase E1 component
VSSASDLCAGSFIEVIPDHGAAVRAKNILVCSGKVYFDLLEERAQQGRKDTAIIRIEQLYPLCTDLLYAALSVFPKKSRISWVQEEPENMGAWRFMQPFLALRSPSVRYVGRPADCCPAVGSHALHLEQQNKIIKNAFDVV